MTWGNVLAGLFIITTLALIYALEYLSIKIERRVQRRWDRR
ncbi:MAG TPA: hypothetical protein VFI41_05025 [Gemmatimonadales bacterium]|nr:hypothetical protein [Gemmatimonadales bacterium]